MSVRLPVKELRRAIVLKYLRPPFAFEKDKLEKGFEERHIDAILKYPKTISESVFYRLIEFAKKDPKKFGIIIGSRAKRFGYGLSLNNNLAQKFFTELGSSVGLFLNSLSNNLGNFIESLGNNQMSIFGRKLMTSDISNPYSKVQEVFEFNIYSISNGLDVSTAKEFGKALSAEQMGVFFNKYISSFAFTNFMRGFGNNLQFFVDGFGLEKFRKFVSELSPKKRIEYARSLKQEPRFNSDFIKLVTGIEPISMTLLPL